MKLQGLFFFVWIFSENAYKTTAHNEQNERSLLPEPDQNRHELAKSINNLGHKILIECMRENINKNIVISPTGIAGLLAITLLGSVGKTYNELADALGFPQDIMLNRQNHHEFSELLHQLNTNDQYSKTLYADGVFVDAHSNLRKVFRDYLTQVYRGTAVNVDFSQAEPTRQTINEWVKTHTEGNIENFLKQTLPDATKTVLLSALYFSGQWAHPFLPDFTMKMPFTTPNKEVLADLMLNMGEFDYFFSKEEGLHMIALPYNDSVTTMYVLKPTPSKNVTLLDLMSGLDYAKIDSFVNQMKKTKSVIRFPKMDLQNNLNLKDALDALGVKTMFVPEEANFALMVDNNTASNKTEELIVQSRMGDVDGNDLKERLNSLPNPGIYVDLILHDVKMTINEFGTVAVAATAGVLARTAELFYVNTPFFVFIRNEKSKLVTFSGVIFDPTEE